MCLEVDGRPSVPMARGPGAKTPAWLVFIFVCDKFSWRHKQWEISQIHPIMWTLSIFCFQDSEFKNHFSFTNGLWFSSAEIPPHHVCRTHPPIFSCSARLWLWRQQVKRVGPNVFLCSHVLQLLLRGAEAFPAQMGYVIPPACYGSAPTWTCPECVNRAQQLDHLKWLL